MSNDEEFSTYEELIAWQRARIADLEQREVNLQHRLCDEQDKCDAKDARIAILEAENERLRDEAYHKAKLAVVGDYADRIAELEALLERYSPDWRIAFEKP